VLGAVAVGLIVLAVAPVPFGVTVRGLVRMQNEQRIFATSPGFIKSIEVVPGQFVDQGQSLIVFDNLEIETRFAEADGNLQVEMLRNRIAQRGSEKVGGRLVWEQSHHSLDEVYANWEMAKRKVEALRVTSPSAGFVQSWPSVRDMGRYFTEGTPIGIVGSGPGVVMIWLTSDQLQQAAIKTGTAVKVRLYLQGVEHHWGSIESIAPQSIDQLTEDEYPITVLAGEPLLIDPKDGHITTPLYKVVVRVEGLDPLSMRRNVKATICLPRKFQPMLTYTIDRVRQFLLTLYTI
jgi:multidrug resistance efflux pump